MKSSQAIARVFSALANPHRVDVLKLLLAAQPSGLTAGALAERTGLAPSTLAHHLREMEAGGVVVRRQRGRMTDVMLNLEALIVLAGTLNDLCCAGPQSMAGDPR